MALQSIIDVEPYQFIAVVSVKLWGESVGLVEQPYSDVNGVREVIVTAREWRPAGLTEGARHAEVDVNRTSFVRREGYR